MAFISSLPARFRSCRSHTFVSPAFPRCAIGPQTLPISRRALLVGAVSGFASLSMSAANAESDVVINDLKAGDGDGFKSGDLVKMHYVLTLGGFQEDGGNVVDSSRSRGRAFSYKYDTGSVIKGWDQGVTGMKVGGHRRLTIPPELGYGARGAGNVIPPNSTLYFDIELLGVGFK